MHSVKDILWHRKEAMDAFATATDMLEALRTRQVTSQELLDLHLRRLERYNPRLNAIVIPNTDARQAAVAADAVRAHGEAQALLGLPLTMKDCLYVARLPTTGGVPERRQTITSMPQCQHAYWT
jgi:amidase